MSDRKKRRKPRAAVKAPVPDAVPDAGAPAAHDILIEIRRIIQSITIHSKKQFKETGLTVPQGLVLQAIGSSGQSLVTAAEVSRQVRLSPATLTGILDRLEKGGFIRRERDVQDRRKVRLSLTEKGAERLISVSPTLQDRFLVRFNSLDEEERTRLHSALRRIVEMIEASSYDASPILAVGDVKDARPQS